MPDDKTARASLVVCAVILSVAALYLLSSILAPLAFALLVLAIVWPFQKWLQQFMPKFVALFLTLAVTIVVVVAFGSLIAWALSGIAGWLIKNLQTFQDIYIRATDWLEGHGIFVAGTLSERFDVVWLLRVFQEVARRLNRTVGFGLLAFVFLMMALLEVNEYRHKIECSGKGKGSKLIQAGTEIAYKFRRYMIVRTALSLLTGLAVWGFAALMGVEPAFAWGVLAFALNYIPFIGPFIATALPGVFALAQIDTWQTLILIIAGLTMIQFLIGNYLEPLVAGAALSISPFVVVFAVFFFGLIWGIPGALIGVPVTIALMTICAQYPKTRWVNDLLSGAAPDEAAKSRKTD
jgi:predicted PurR-regulated permease PerM